DHHRRGRPRREVLAPVQEGGRRPRQEGGREDQAQAVRTVTSGGRPRRATAAPAADRIEIGGTLDVYAAEALTLEIQRLARDCGIEVTLTLAGPRPAPARASSRARRTPRPRRRRGLPRPRPSRAGG